MRIHGHTALVLLIQILLLRSFIELAMHVWFTCVDIRNGSNDELPLSDNVNIVTAPMSMEGTLVFLLQKLVEKRREGHRPEELSVSDRCMMITLKCT